MEQRSNKLAFTICSANYLAQAIALGDSLLQHNPGYTFVIGLVDEINENTDLPVPIAYPLIPIKDIDKNITLKFKKYWTENTSAPFTEIFNYILHISKSNWYKEYKSK
jgi:hypothetical protein